MVCVQNNVLILLHKLFDDAALVSELAGLYFIQKGDKEWATHFFTKACLLYREWGAYAKFDQIQELHSDMIRSSFTEHFLAASNEGDNDSSTGGGHFRGRSRFSSKPAEQHYNRELITMHSDHSFPKSDNAKAKQKRRRSRDSFKMLTTRLGFGTG